MSRLANTFFFFGANSATPAIHRKHSQLGNGCQGSALDDTWPASVPMHISILRSRTAVCYPHLKSMHMLVALLSSK